MKVFDLFLNKYPPGKNLRKPTAEMLEQFKGKLPEELLGFWQEYGFRKLWRRITENYILRIMLTRLHFGWGSRKIVILF